MKLKIKRRTIQAYRTRNAGEIDRVMAEAENVQLPDALYHVAADIAHTVVANMRKGAHDVPDTVAAYVLRYAYVLAQSGELQGEVGEDG